MESQQIEIVHLMGIPISQLDVPELVSEVVGAVDNKQRLIVAYANLYALNLAHEQKRVYEFFTQHANIVLCDGYGAKLGGRLLGVNIHHRLTSQDWIGELFKQCVQKGYSIFLLGARADVLERTAQHLCQEYPGIRIAGTEHGYFDKQQASAGNLRVIQAINDARPHIVLVAFGMPVQELWLMDNWEKLDAQSAITVGAMFNYMGGELRRPPRWMTNHGLEWFGRLLMEPRRLWRRYIIGNPRFFWRLLKYSLSIRPVHMQDNDP